MVRQLQQICGSFTRDQLERMATCHYTDIIKYLKEAALIADDSQIRSDTIDNVTYDIPFRQYDFWHR